MNPNPTADSHDPVKRFGLVVGGLTGASIVLYSIAMLISKDSHIAMAVASLPIIAVSHLYELLERMQSRHGQRAAAQEAPPVPVGATTTPQQAAKIETAYRQEAAAQSIATFEGYGLPWFLMAVYGALILPAVMQLSSGLGGILGAVFGGTNDAAVNAVVVAISMSLSLIGSFFIGKWIGTRCHSKGLIAVAITVVLGTALCKGLDFAMVPSDQFYNIFQHEKSLPAYLGHCFIASLMMAGPCFLGYWRGRQARLTAYLRYLLKVLPRDTGDLIVRMAYEEAQRLAAERIISRSASAPQPASSPARMPPPLPVEASRPAPKKPQTLPV